MSYLYESRDVSCVAALTEKQKASALADVGLAAVRYVETNANSDFVLLRYAACRFQTYDNLAREAAMAKGGPR